MNAIFAPLVVFMALHAPLSTTADSRASPPDAERHDHSAQDQNPDPHQHADQETHDGSDTVVGVPAADPDLDDYRHDEGQVDGHESEASQEAHDEHGHDSEAITEVHLSPVQRQTLSLQISVLESRPLGNSFRVPGEVRLNAYATAQVTPRIEAQVLARHARLGDQVEAGEPLVVPAGLSGTILR